MVNTLKQLWGGLQDEQATAFARALLRWGAGVLLLISALVLYGPGLGSSRFVFGTDTVSHDYIMHYYAWQKSVNGAGQLPLWNPYMFSGMPMIGSAAICPFYPSQWLYAILPFNTAFTLQYALALAIGGIGAAWWMRCLNHRRAVCVWAGLLYMVSGHFLTLTHAGHLQKMIALGWVPIALGATIQVVKTGGAEQRRSDRYRAACLLGIALGMQLLATHPQIFYATAAACVLQLLGLAVYTVPWKSAILAQTAADGTSTASHAFARIGRAALMSLLALVVCVAIAAVQLFPTMEMSALSNRADGVSFEEATATSYPPAELLEYAIPAVFGNSVKDYHTPYFGSWGERIVTDYLGLPVLILALIGLFGSKRRYRWFLLILLFTGVIIGLGRHTPLYWLLWKTLPGFDGFRSPGTFMFLTNCALIGLSALGLDYLLNLADSVNSRGWGSALASGTSPPPPDDEGDSLEDKPARATSSYNADETQPFNVEELADQLPDNAPPDYVGTDTPPQGVPAMRDTNYEDLEADPGFSYTYPDSTNTRASSNFTWENESSPWLGRPGVLVFLAAVAIASLAAAIIALAENWGVDLRIATDAERMSYHTHSRVAIVAVALMCLLASIILLRVRTWVGGLAIGITALSFPMAHNLQYLRFDPLPPYRAHLTRQVDLQALADNAARPVRMLEENALKNEDMLYEISSVSGYHPIQPAAYVEMAENLGFGSTEFGSLFAVNYSRAHSESPPGEGEWSIVEDYPDGAGGSRIWHRNPAFPWLRENATLEILSPTDETPTEQVSALLQRAGAAGIAQMYAARISLEDARRHRLVEGPQRVNAQLQRWSPHEIRLRVEGTPAREGARVLLPTSDPYFPGWKAETSRAQPLAVIPVNAVQRAVALPQGEQNIRFIYKPYSFRLGLFVSLFSATLLLFYGLGTVTRRLTRGQRKLLKVVRRVQTGQQQTIAVQPEKDSV